MGTEKVLRWILKILFVVFAILLIIQITLKLIGGSPTDIQILYVAFGAIVSYLLVMSYKMGTFVGEVREFMKTTKNTFSSIKQEKLSS